MPVGPSLRTESHVLTLIATTMPHAPRLQPNEVSNTPWKVGLLITPLDGSAATPVMEIAKDVPPVHGFNGPRLLGVSGDRVWIRSGGVYVYDLRSRRLSAGGSPPMAVKDARLSESVTTGWRVSEARWLGVHLPEDVATGKLKPGSPLMPGIFPLRSLPYEALRDSEIPKRERRRLYSGQVDVSGPIPRLAKMEPVGADEYRNGVVLTDSAASDGALIAYEGQFPDLSLHVRRVDAEGKTLWTVNTRIRRDLQLLPGREVLALRGTPQVPDGKFPQPIVVLLNPRTGQMTASELRW
jgi:hypothetical protein